jgi:DNA-binding response OmpR family regulator
LATPETVLCVDDDIQLTDLLCYALTRAGYETRMAHNGAEALSAAEHACPNIVILDANLPDVDGFLLCERFQTLYQVPVIMLTARSAEVDVLSGFKQGADDYITKPFSMQILLQRLAAILRRQRSVQQPATLR